MPVGISSAARNLFLLGSSGADVVTNFFKAIDQSASGDDQFVAKAIKYSEYDEKFILGLKAEDGNSKKHALIEKRDADGVLDWNFEIESTTTATTNDTILTDIHLDVNGKLLAVGQVGDVPFVARYTNNGLIEWSSTTNSAGVKYHSITSDSSGQYYACGNTSALTGDSQAFVEKYDANGNPGWGKSAINIGSDIVLHAIDSNSRGEVVAGGYLQDINNNFKGYFVKLDTATGNVLWDRTLEITNRDWGTVPVTEINDVMIDGNDFIYLVGAQFNGVTGDSAGFICKYSPEGNMLWQKETPLNPANLGRWRYNCVEADTATGQIVILGSYFENASDEYGVLVKYSSDGTKVFTRVLESTESSPPEFGTLATARGGMALDADPSFYYILFTDQETNPGNLIPDKYTFGKVSSSGNGLGAFSYDTGDVNTIEYYIQDIGDRIGRLSDGSVRNDTSDLATNILNPTKIMFDDLATPIANKKRQIDSADSFEYSGSPAVRPVDFGSMNLLGDIGASDGPELIQNGTFDSDVSGWTAETSTINWSNGKLQTNRSGGSGYTSYQVIPTEIGKRYTVRATIESTGTGGRQDIRVLSDLSSTGSLLSTDPVNGSNGFTVNAEFHFTAVGTTSYVYTVSDGFGTGFFDNISVKESAIWSDRSGKGNNAIVNGPTYNSGGGYWEFDATDYRIIFGPKCNELFEDGAGGTIEMWVKLNDISARQTLCSGYMTSGSTQPDRWDFEVQSGIVRGGFHDNGYSTSDSITTNTWYNFMFVLDKSGGDNGLGEIRLYINGVEESNWSGSLTVDRDFATDVEFGIGNRYLQQEDFPLDGDVGEVRIYPKTLTETEIFQNYNSTKSKYINEAPDTAPKIGPGIVYDSTRMILNFDFGNRATYDGAENLIADNEVRYTADGGIWQDIGRSTLEYGFDDPFGTKTATKVTRTTGDGLIRIPNYTLTGDGPWTFSAYAKIISGSGDIRLDISDFSPAKTSQTISKDEWTRVEFTYQTSEVNTGASADYLDIECGPGITEWLIAGIQLERGSTAGRPIRTYGSAITASTTVNNLCGSPGYGFPGPGTISGPYPVFNSDGYFEFGQIIDAKITGPFDYDDVTYRDFTVEAWVWGNNWNVNGDVYNAILNRSDGSSHIFSTYITSSGELGSWFFTDAGAITTSTSSSDGDPTLTLSTGTWNHCVWIMNEGAGMEYYLNNSAASMYSNTNARRKDNSNQTFTIGTWNLNAYELDGRIGEIRFYNRKLFASEISQNFNATRGKYGV